MNSLLTDKPIFPKVELKRNGVDSVALETYLRKQDADGVWCHTKISTSWYGERDIDRHYAEFIHLVYSFLTVGLISHHIVHPIDGLPLHTIDEYQGDEETRMIEILTHK